MVTRIKKTNFVQTIYTVFSWNTCCKCDMEFRRETGFRLWKTLFLLSNPFAGVYSYLCRTCGKDKDNANSIFKEFLKGI